MCKRRSASEVKQKRLEQILNLNMEPSARMRGTSTNWQVQNCTWRKEDELILLKASGRLERVNLHIHKYKIREDAAINTSTRLVGSRYSKLMYTSSTACLPLTCIETVILI